MKPFATHKFGAHRCEIDGKKFPSKLEKNTYLMLEKLKASGHVLFFLRQVPIEITTGVHRVDFLVFLTNGEAIFLESKGRDLEAGRMRRKMAEESTGCQIHVVTDPKEIYQLLSIT